MRWLFQIGLASFNRFLRDDGWAIASHVALSSLTSLFPFLIFLTSLAGLFGSQELASEATQTLFDAWPARVADPIVREVHAVMTQARGGLLTLGGALALYFSASAVEAIRIALNRAYDAIETRPWWVLRLHSIAYVLIGSIALLASSILLVLGPLISSILKRVAPDVMPAISISDLLRYAIAGGALLVALTIAHLWLPANARQLRFRDIAPGVLLTFVLSVAGSISFGLYLAEFANNYVTTYAGLASFMIALVFLYLLAALTIFGGELNGALLAARRSRLR